MRFRPRQDPRVADELRFHRDRLVNDYLAAGLPRHEAERRATVEFGSLAGIEGAVRDVRGRRLDDLAADVRYTLRTLRRTPAFAVAAVLTFALGIGANVAIFSLINALLLRALPVREPDRLVRIVRIT